MDVYYYNCVISEWHRIYDTHDLILYTLVLGYKENYMMQDGKDTDSIPQYSQEVLEQNRKSLSRLYTFIKRYVRKTISLAESGLPYAMGLFSKDGILLDLYAKDDMVLDWFAENGIRAAGDWSHIGFNAVSEGLHTMASLSSVGEANEHEILKGFAIYFAPINMLSPYEPYEPMEQCGVAIIAPLEHAWPEYLTMIRGTAHDMMITLQFNNIATMYYERSGKGVLSIDNMMSPDGANLATYYNMELFRILEVDPISMYYQPVEAMIDPLPANQELWDIVRSHRTVGNHPMRVSVRGHEVEVIASTDAFNQPTINAHGVTFYFTTQQKITAELSDKVANGAIKTFDDIIGGNSRLKEIIQRAKRMALTESNIMILGESGTGKDIFAQAIHNASARRNKPFIALNCGALPRDLIESELFGYEDGAFSGARRNGNIGKFELANGGTIFLDEIGEMPLDLQVRLLRVTEQKQFMRLGGSKLIKADVRIIAATNANIEEMIGQKQFRADLFYRLSTMKLNLPSLRERKDDILPLSEHFIRSISRRIKKTNIMRFSPKALELLAQLNWSGNIRELQNLIECIVQIYPGDIILPEYILDNVSYDTKKEILESGGDCLSIDIPTEPDPPAPPTSVESERAAVPAAHRRQKLNRDMLLDALRLCNNNRSAAAEYLGVSRRTLYRKLEEFGID